MHKKTPSQSYCQSIQNHKWLSSDCPHYDYSGDIQQELPTPSTKESPQPEVAPEDPNKSPYQERVDDNNRLP